MEITELTIGENNTVLEAMQKLDYVASKVLFVIKEEKLIAALTDGDIRRWILNQGNLKALVKEVANYNPKFLLEEDSAMAIQYMKEYCIEAVPIVDKNNRIVKIVFWNENELVSEHSKLQIPVVMMAGGLGTRLWPYTKILPKPLIPIGDTPIAEHIINQLHKYGCEDFYLVVNHKKNMIKAYFNELEKEYNVFFIDEDKPLGTGGGLSLLKGKIKTTFILTNCDILVQENFDKIYQLHKEKEHLITMVCSLKTFSIPYGVVEIGQDGSIAGMKEKPQLSFFTNTGCYIVEPEVLDGLQEEVAIGFPDIIEQCKEKGGKVGIFPIGEKAWMDMGNMDELKRMEQILGYNNEK